MKELLLNIITEIMNSTKTFIVKSKNNIKFENYKNGIIKVMYSPIIEKKENEANILLLQSEKLKKETDNLDVQIDIIKKENALYRQKINALIDFQKCFK